MVVNVLRVLELRYLEGFFVFTRAFAKPLLASVAMVLAMVVCEAFLSGTVLLVVGVVVGTCAFALALSVVGIEERDRQLFGLLLSQYRERTPRTTSTDAGD